MILKLKTKSRETEEVNQRTKELELAFIFEVEKLEDRIEFVHWDKNHVPVPGKEGWVESIQ